MPAQPTDLVGREEELAEIGRLVADRGSGAAVVVIDGVAGIGKSALAVTWAQGAAADFPDGQLFIRLGAFDPDGPVEPGEALGQALRAMGIPPQRVPFATAEQAALFRSITAGRSLLLLLDNAFSAAQVRHLLPASESCVVLVTARWRLGGLLGEGARFLTLRTLPARDATVLLTGAIGADRIVADRPATAELVELCDGLPMALVVAGARLATRPAWSVRRLVTDLTEEHRRLRGLAGRDEVSVRGAFDLSYQHLSPPARRCYRTLGLLPGAEFGAGLVATALAVSEQTANGLLEHLLDANLLTEPVEDRYLMHDLVRLHAREHAATDADREPTRRRILEWHLAGALAADRILTPYRRRDRQRPLTLIREDAVLLADRDAALAWLDRERANLVAAVREAAPDLPMLAWELADAMWPLFHLRRHHQDRAKVDRIAVDCARRLSDPDLETRMLRRWAFAHVDVNDLEMASELFRRGLDLCAERGDTYGVAAAAEGLGVVALRQRRYPAATDHFTHQMRLCGELGDQRRVGLALLNLGMVDNDSGNHARAARGLRRAAETFAASGVADPYNAARVRIELGRAFSHLDDHEAAGRELAGALVDMRALGSLRGQAQALHRLGELALARLDRRRASDHLAQALSLFRQLGDLEAAEVEELLRSL